MMEIREANPGDFEALKSFYARMNEIINTRTHVFHPENAVFPSDEMVMNAIAHHQQFVGIQDGVIAAACIADHSCDDAYHRIIWQTDASPEEFWVLHALRVLPEYEGRGLAKQMLSHLISLARAQGQKAIRLDVLEGYDVVHLYHSFGFRHVDTVEILYEDIGYPKRFCLLEKVIQPE